MALWVKKVPNPWSNGWQRTLSANLCLDDSTVSDGASSSLLWWCWTGLVFFTKFHCCSITLHVHHVHLMRVGSFCQIRLGRILTSFWTLSSTFQLPEGEISCVHVEGGWSPMDALRVLESMSLGTSILEDTSTEKRVVINMSFKDSYKWQTRLDALLKDSWPGVFTV